MEINKLIEIIKKKITKEIVLQGINVEDKSSSLKIKDVSGIKKSISTLLKGIFE